MREADKFSSSYEPELRLLVSACKWSLDEVAIEQINLAAIEPIDWDLFVSFVKCHRVTPLAFNGLINASVDMPSSIKKLLAADVQQFVRTALVDAQEVVRLQQILIDKRIDSIELKGTSTGLLAYGKLGMKQSWDIDLLVDSQLIEAAHDILLETGYKMVYPEGLSGAELYAARSLLKEAVYQLQGAERYVELHWRLIDHPDVLGDVGMKSDLQDVPVANAAIKALADPELYCYLVAHGSYHCWSRLKWIADLAAFLSRFDTSEIRALHQRAVQLGIEAQSKTTLALVDELFGQASTAALPFSWTERRLLANIHRCIRLGSRTTDVEKYTELWFRLHVAAFFLNDGRGYKFNILARALGRLKARF